MRRPAAIQATIAFGLLIQTRPAFAHGQETLLWFVAPPTLVILALAIGMPMWRAKPAAKFVTGIGVLLATAATTAATARFAKMGNVQWFVLGQFMAPILTWLVGWLWARRSRRAERIVAVPEDVGAHVSRGRRRDRQQDRQDRSS